MPRLTANGRTAEVPEGQRLVLAIEGLGVPIGHRCGGKARCTTCRVRFAGPPPDRMTRAEYVRLRERGLLGQVRLSCQLVCDRDLNVEALMTMDSEQWPDPGPPPALKVEPEPVWYPVEQLAAEAGD